MQYQYSEHEDQPYQLPVLGQVQFNTPFFAAPNNNNESVYYTDLNIHENFNPALGNVAFDITGNPGIISTAFAPGVRSLPVLDPATGVYSRQLGADWHATTGVAGLEWTPTDNTLGYFKYSKGYKAGGLNAGSLVAVPETAPEYLDAYELGGKFTSKKFQINEALFYYNYKGKQIPLSVQPEAGPAISEVFNIPKVRSFGAETEAIWSPIANLQFPLDYSFMEATIDTHFKAINTVQQNLLSGLTPAQIAAQPSPTEDVYGNTVPFAPRHKVALNSNYTFRFTPGSLNLSASYVWKIHTYSSIFNEPYTLAPSYSTVDLRTTWNDINDRYTVFAYVHNLANKNGWDGVSSGAVVNEPFFGPNSTSQTPGLIPPRQFGVEVQYRLK